MVPTFEQFLQTEEAQQAYDRIMRKLHKYDPVLGTPDRTARVLKIARKAYEAHLKVNEPIRLWRRKEFAYAGCLYEVVQRPGTPTGSLTIWRLPLISQQNRDVRCSTALPCRYIFNIPIQSAAPAL